MAAGSDRRAWRAQAQAFADTRCLFVDLPEHGRSLEAGPFSIDGTVTAVAALIRARAPAGRAHLVGHSLGGIVVLHLLAAAAEVVDHAVVASGNLHPSALYRVLASWPACLLLSAAGRLTGRGTPAAVLHRLYGETLRHLRIPEGLAAAEAPTLLLAGDREPAFLRASNREVAARLPHARALVVAAAGHLYPFETPERFEALVRRWLADASVDDLAGVRPDPGP